MRVCGPRRRRWPPDSFTWRRSGKPVLSVLVAGAAVKSECEALRSGGSERTRPTLLPDPAPLKAIRVERLRGEATVLRRELREQRIVEPVMCVDDVDVVAGPDDPAEA